jgi:asparagine synthase (glutamine-hydrolysing)
MPREFEAALRSLSHRGPDDEGYVFIDSKSGSAIPYGGDDTPASTQMQHIRSAPTGNGDIVLGARRLAIQDLTSAGHQPMATTDRKRWLVHNGEIYNFHALRGELQALGHQFSTGTDTEVLLRAYEQWGLDCLHRLNGMWAFALWDGRQRRLLLARDRYGVKPLYYTWRDGTLTFASEIKAILALSGSARAANPSVVDDYLAFGVVDHTNETFFDGVLSLPPGHVLELDVERGTLSRRQWYTLADDSDLTSADAAERFRALFSDAVRLRLISDVPVGTCLSGGLDSSSIVTVADRLLREGSRAGSADRQLVFAARYDDARHDEGSYIEAVAAATAAELHVVRPTSEGLRDDLEALVWHQDEPFGSTSIYAQFTVFRLARLQGCAVTLDGQGGDEVAGGYMHYFGPNLARLARAARVGSLIREVRGYRSHHPDPLGSLAVRTGAALMPWPVRQRLARRVRRPDWLKPGAGPTIDPARVTMPSDPLRAQIYRDLTVGLRQLLRFADRNSMAHSVESRLPFLDYRLVELFYAAPGEAKIVNGITKVALRTGLSDVLPRTVHQRHDKIGFSTPDDVWFRTTLRPTIDELLRSPSFRARPWFDHEAVDRTWRRFQAGDDLPVREVWRWVNLELWHRAFLD